jgi:hypothetical protein
MRIFGVFVLLAWSFYLAPMAHARDIFVDNLGGDDRYDGVQEVAHENGGPVRTITRALMVAGPSDRIVLANHGEPYREMISLSAGNNCGSPGHPLVIDGRGATLDGSRPIPNDAWESHKGPVFRFLPPRLAYQQLFIDDKPAVRRFIVSSEGRLPDLAPLEWCALRGYIYFRVEDGKLPESYRLSYAALQTGITLDHVHDIALVNLTVQGFQLDGINAHDGVDECRLAGITSRGNGRSGLTVAGCSHVEADECLIGNNGLAQVLTQDLSITSITRSQVLDSTAPALERQGGIVFVDGKRK